MASTQELTTFFKKKGFIYPSSEIYGGVAGLYDYGHLGAKLKRNFENLWRSYFLGLDDNYYEIETASIMPEKVFRASGHLEHFTDLIAKCSRCEFSERADLLVGRESGKRAEGLSKEELDGQIKRLGIKCPKCRSGFRPVEETNLMFSLPFGAGGQQKVFLRPETAQSPYVNFKLQYELLRKKMPLGLALVGRAYRNEISPRNLTLRMREFTQAELQIFFNPAKIKEHKHFDLVRGYKLRVVLASERKKGKTVERTAGELAETFPQFYVYHLARIQQFYLEELKIPPEKFRLYELNEQEKAFYNQYHFDIEVELSEHGFTEMGGLHYRTDHDLKGHQAVSGENMEILDENSGKKFIPHVLELSFGVDRNVYALLDLNYNNDQERGNVILHLPAKLTPFFSAVFPLVRNKPEIVAKAEEVYEKIKNSHSCFYDETSSVGRRYARADEIGVRWIITVDFDSLEDHGVTIRDREDTRQERVSISRLGERLAELSAEHA